MKSYNPSLRTFISVILYVAAVVANCGTTAAAVFREVVAASRSEGEQNGRPDFFTAVSA